MNVLNSCICIARNWKQMSINRSVDRQNVMFPHNEIFHREEKREERTDTSRDMEKPQNHYTQGSQTQEAMHCMIPFTWTVQKRQF